MFDNSNRALNRTTSPRGFGFGPLNLAGIESEAGALEAARSAWWAAAWLAFGFALGIMLIALTATSYAVRGLPILLGIDGAGLIIFIGLAWLIRAKQPRWAIILVLIVLILNLLGQLLSLRIGISLIINGVLIYTTIHSVRGAFRLAAYRRGRPSEAALHETFS